MGFCSRRPSRVPLESQINWKRHLLWARNGEFGHLGTRKKQPAPMYHVTCSIMHMEVSEYDVYRGNLWTTLAKWQIFRLVAWRFAICLQPFMLWGMLSWSKLDPLISVDSTLNSTAYLIRCWSRAFVHGYNFHMEMVTFSKTMHFATLLCLSHFTLRNINHNLTASLTGSVSDLNPIEFVARRWMRISKLRNTIIQLTQLRADFYVIILYVLLMIFQFKIIYLLNFFYCFKASWYLLIDL